MREICPSKNPVGLGCSDDSSGWILCGWALKLPQLFRTKFLDVNPSYFSGYLASSVHLCPLFRPEPLSLSFHWNIIKLAFTANGKVLHTKVTIPSTGSSQDRIH
ncbi:uncharacterized protein [Lolium perenne]|uniref:uncharacterized protein n=1 Tax=Lolium perenne TaxID=4522 RepID=UPI003A99434C